MAAELVSPEGDKKVTRDAVEILDRRAGDAPQLRELVAEEEAKLEIALLIYKARKAAGLTQEQLAELVGTHQPDIARLEDADYDGHSLSMLRRIASALNKRIELRFVDKEPQSA